MFQSNTGQFFLQSFSAYSKYNKLVELVRLDPCTRNASDSLISLIFHESRTFQLGWICLCLNHYIDLSLWPTLWGSDPNYAAHNDASVRKSPIYWILYNARSVYLYFFMLMTSLGWFFYPRSSLFWNIAQCILPVLMFIVLFTWVWTFKRRP